MACLRNEGLVTSLESFTVEISLESGCSPPFHVVDFSTVQPKDPSRSHTHLFYQLVPSLEDNHPSPKIVPKGLDNVS